MLLLALKKSKSIGAIVFELCVRTDIQTYPNALPSAARHLVSVLSGAIVSTRRNGDGNETSFYIVYILPDYSIFKKPPKETEADQ